MLTSASIHSSDACQALAVKMPEPLVGGTGKSYEADGGVEAEYREIKEEAEIGVNRPWGNPGASYYKNRPRVKK